MKNIFLIITTILFAGIAIANDEDEVNFTDSVICNQIKLESFRKEMSILDQKWNEIDEMSFAQEQMYVSEFNETCKPLLKYFDCFKKKLKKDTRREGINVPELRNGYLETANGMCTIFLLQKARTP